MPTVIKTCSCSNAFQDKKYGKKRRVHNTKANGGTRCTVCLKETKE